MSETLEEYADRIVAASRRKLLDRLDDDVIGTLGKSHLIFGKMCAMEAVSTAMVEVEKTRLTSPDPMKELCEAAEEVQAARKEWLAALPDSEAERGANLRIVFAHIGLRTALENAKGGGR